MKKISIIILLCLSVAAQAQTDNRTTTIIEADGNSCELNSLYFDRILQSALEENLKIVVIFRAGKSERRIVNKRRLAYVKNFLRNNKGWEPRSVIYARGESEGNPKIEFLLGGKIQFITMTKKNRTPCLDCCGVREFEPQDLTRPKKTGL